MCWRALDQWSREVVSGWHDWIDLPLRAGDALGALLGAAPGEVIATDSVTVNLYKLVCAALDARGGGALVTDRGNFPTDRYVLEGIAAARGLELRIFDSDELDGPVAADLGGLGEGDVVVLSHVAYRSGALADMAGLTAAARERGATLIWDLSHSAGAVPVDLRARGRRAGRRLHLQVPQRRAGGARLPVRRAPSCRARCARRSRAGSARATSSPWSATTTRCPGSRASSRARRRSSSSPRSRRARS